MFCPKCATANSDQAKFCRACGTNLETVAMALAGELAPPADASKTKDRRPQKVIGWRVSVGEPADASETKDKRPRTHEEWLEKWGKGVRETVQGSILLAVYLLVGFSLLAVLPEWRVDSILMWFILAGAMAVWGVVMLARGIGIIVEAKPILREWERIATEQAGPSTTPLLAQARDVPVPPRPLVTSEVSPPSVTEHTTEMLGEYRAPYPERGVPEHRKT